MTEPLPPIASTRYSAPTCPNSAGSVLTRIDTGVSTVASNDTTTTPASCARSSSALDAVEDTALTSRMSTPLATMSLICEFIFETSLSALAMSKSSISGFWSAAYCSSATIWLRQELPTKALARPTT